MPTDLRVAVIGATGLVGERLLRGLERYGFPVGSIALYGSKERTALFGGKERPVLTLDSEPAESYDLVLMSAGSGVSRQYARSFEARGALVVDNSSAWRREPSVPLVVPEINGGEIPKRGLVANPNCTTIQLVLPLAAMMEFGVEEVVLTSLQAVSGAGGEELERLRRGERYLDDIEPYIGETEGGVCGEEEKVIYETRRILGLPKLDIAATTTRVPVETGHSESVTVRLGRAPSATELKGILAAAPGVKLHEEPFGPAACVNSPWVHVSRLRVDGNRVSLFSVSDNLEKGAALNALQIAAVAFQLPYPGIADRHSSSSAPA